MMSGSLKITESKGFTLVEVIITLAIIGALATISIPNFNAFVKKAELASVLTTLKYLMDGEDYYFLENDAFFAVNVPSGKAMDIPELAYSFPEGHKNQYRITVTNNRNRNRYVIRANCDFDSNGNGRDDRFTATTDIRRGEVLTNREVVQLR